MKLFIILLILLTNSPDVAIYTAKSGEIIFFSEAPLENIEAKSTSVNSLINLKTKEVAFIIPMTSFKFQKELMREHFNEKYVESARFPEARFKGKILEDIDFSKEGVYQVTATGPLVIHGIEKEHTEKGTLTVKSGKIHLETQFYVLLKDHKIEIPTLVTQKIAEKVLVKVKADYLPYHK